MPRCLIVDYRTGGPNLGECYSYTCLVFFCHFYAEFDMPFLVLLLMFIFVPLVELYTLIAVGSRIGALSTILLCLLTAGAGAFMIRYQGLATIQKMQATMASGQLPATEMLHGAILLVCGILMLTPGFITDCIGFLLLIPPARDVMIGLWIARFDVVESGSSFESHNVTIIEGDFEEIEDDRR